MTGDLRARVHDALAGRVVLGGDDRVLMAGPVDDIVQAVLAALGDPETQWATDCGGRLYPGAEETARYRARAAAHTLLCRQIVVLHDWHKPTNVNQPEGPTS